MKRTKTKSIFGALCLFFGISLFSVFCNIILNAVSASAYSITVTTSGSMTADVFPAAGDNIGTTIVTDNVGVISNCRAGYTLSISGPSDNNLYLNGSSSNNTTGTYFTPVDGTNALNSTVNANKWGYSLTATTQNGIFTPLSNTANTLLTPSQTASPNSDINTVTPIYYGTSVNKDMPPGSYTFSNNNAITYNVVMDATCMVVNIAYDGNNADAGTMGAAGTGVIHTGVKDGDTVNLIASNFSRTGYGFAGWSLDPNAGAKLIDNDSTNNPIVYGPQETVTLPNGFMDNDTDNDGIVKLYAVWIPSQGNLQGWMGCSSLDTTTYDSTTGALDLTKKSVTALTDQRDNDTYAVARLADGQCWMIENLRLDNDAAHNSDGLLAQGYGTSTTYGNFSGLADAESTNFTNSTTANSLYYSGTQSGTASINIGTSNYQDHRMPRYNNWNNQSTSANRPQNPTTNDATNSTTNAGMYSYGNYYTWHAAIADTTHCYSGDHNTTSICPTGWQLPLGNTSTGDIEQGAADVANKVGGFSYLDRKMGGTGANQSTTADSLRWRKFPVNFLYSGNFDGSSASYRGSYGYYWSSTANPNSNSYYLRLDSSNMRPGTSYFGKTNGSSIRCVASEPANYALTYDANGGSGAPSSQSTTANGSATFTVSNITPTRSGYTFAGWTDEKGNETQPGASFTTKDPNAVLYAIWTNNSCNPTATTIGTGNTSTDAVCLQDVTPSMKAALPTATATTGTYNLIDARDGQSYTVAKLADGNLWLTKNLNYGSNSDMLLTSHDTDLPTNKTFKAPASTTAFETTNTTAAYVSPKILTDNTYGGYYSYAAAIASTDAYSTSNQNITTSICPKGWDLPTRTIYNNLLTTSGNTTFAKMSAAPYSFIYAGYKDGTNTPTSQTSALRLWTSTNYNGSYAYYTTAYSTASYSSNYKHYGESVRCVASNGTATINYNANGGTGTMTSQINADINSTTVSSNSFTAPASSQFRNWNTKADGTGTTVAAGASVSSVASNGDTITLYAQWDEIYTLTFINTALTSNNIRTKIVVVGQSAAVAPSSSWSRTGYKLIGWDTVTNDGSGSAGTAAYTNGQSITPTSDMTFYTVWRPTYSITYDINTTDSNAAGTMGNQTSITEGDSVTLLASNFSRTGYGFAGWSLDPNAVNNTRAKIYGPQETITAPAYPGTNTLTFYAVWVASAGSIQNTSTVSGICNNLTKAPTGGTANISSVSALTDQRDNQTYAIAKLADGSCWMIENLRLENTGTDNTTGSLAQGYGGQFAGLAAPESAWANSSTTANSLYSTNGANNTINIGTSNAGYRFPRHNHNNINSRASSPTTNSAAMYSYGNYYTWAAAVADTTDYSTRNQSVTGTSLCPAGWHIPTGGLAYASGNTSGVNVTGNTSTFRESYNLGYKIMNEVKTAYEDKPNGGQSYYSSDTTDTAGKTAIQAFRSFPNNFVYSGVVRSGSVYDRGSIGHFWSSTSYSSYAAYSLGLLSSTVYPGTYYYNKFLGVAVRCVVSGS